MKTLSGRVAVVAGATGVVGSAICCQLAYARSRVVLTYKYPELEARAFSEQLPGSDHLVVGAVADDSSTLAELPRRIAAHYSRLDLLVNNAGVTRFVPHDDLWVLANTLIDRIFRVNWRGAFACVRALKDLLSGSGVVINISSLVGVMGNDSNVAYCRSKAALDSITCSRAGHPRGVRFTGTSGWEVHRAP